MSAHPAAMAAPLRLTNPRLAALQAAWAAQALQAYRACDLCCDGATVAGRRVCNSPALPTTQRAQPVHITRQSGGACGPEAARMRTAWTSN